MEPIFVRAKTLVALSPDREVYKWVVHRWGQFLANAIVLVCVLHIAVGIL
jgi:hypothetical protein